MPYIGKSPSGTGVRTRFLYTATASQTTFSGADTQNLTLSYSDSNFIDVHQNGVLLKIVDDYTATSGTSVVLGTGATADDVIEITVYDIFSVANHVKKSGDIMTGSLDLNGSELILDSDGDTSITSDTDDQIDIKIGGTDKVSISDGSFTITGHGTGSAAGPTLNIFRDSSSPADSDDLGTIRFKGKNSADETTIYAEITAETRDVTDGTEDGYIDFNIPIAGTIRNVFEIGTQEVVINEESVDVDFRVESNNNSVMLYVDAGNDHVNIGTITDHGGVLNVESTDNTDTLVLVSTDADENEGPILKLDRNSSSPANNDKTGFVSFTARNAANESVEISNIETRITDITDGAEDCRLILRTIAGGTLNSRIDIQSDVTVFNEGSNNLDFRIESNGVTHMFFVDAGNNQIRIGGNNNINSNSVMMVNGDSNQRAADFYRPISTATSDLISCFSDSGSTENKVWNVEVNGDVRSDGTFIGSSDQRLKQDIVDSGSQWDDIKAVRVRKYRKKALVATEGDNAPVELGVIAQELEASNMSGLVKTYPKDEDNAEETKGVKYSILYMKAVKALQEAMARIETLEAKVTALESK